MRCMDIHNESDGCLQDIPGNARDWRYCPQCGRPTGHVLAPDCRFELTQGLEEPRTITLRADGCTAITASVSLDSTQVRFDPTQLTNLVIDPQRNEQIRMIVAPLQSSSDLGHLIIQSDDAPLDPNGDPWGQTCLGRARRPFRVSIRGLIDRQMKIEPMQEVLIFRDGVPERTVELENPSREPLRVEEVGCPAGYRATPLEALIPAHSSYSFSVRRVWNENADADAQLFFHLKNGQRVSADLLSLDVGGVSELVRAVIGIDFGTAFSSIAFRECRNHPTLEDDVVLLKPSGEDRSRFPTRIFIGNNGDLVCGSAATKRYHEDLTAGFLFREIKTLLRSPDELQFHPEEKGKDAAIRIAVERFGENWRQELITQYLAWLNRTVIKPELNRRFGDMQVTVQYVFSEPVLDSSHEQPEQYPLQHGNMVECVRNAGFPMDRVDFQFEPVCAALGLLKQPSDADDWPKLGSGRWPIAKGDRIAIFDSGGGTTDVVLAEAEIDEDVHITLKVLHCLGVGHKVGVSSMTSRSTSSS